MHGLEAKPGERVKAFASLTTPWWSAFWDGRTIIVPLAWVPAASRRFP